MSVDRTMSDGVEPETEAATSRRRRGYVPSRSKGGHLYQLDIVRIVTFAGVIFDHCVSGTTFPTNVASNAVQTVFHYTRNAFFALTGFVLVYQYKDRELKPLEFWRKRYKAVGLPFVVWTVFYWLYHMYIMWPPAFSNIWRTFETWDSTKTAFKVLGYDLLTGDAWYHLYFVFVTLQVYLLFPFLLKFLRWSWGYHKYLLAASLAFHLVLLQYMTNVRPEIFNYGLLAKLWNHLPATFIPYQFFTLLGCVAAMHLPGVKKFMSRFRGWVIAAAGVSIGVSVMYYLGLVDDGMFPVTAANVFRPFYAAMFVLIIMALYAAGTIWSERRTPGSFWDRFLKTASDRSFGIFLVHGFALQELAPTIQRFRFEVYAPIVTVITFIVTCFLTVGISEVLRRTPVSLFTTGRKMIPMAQQGQKNSLLIGAAMVIAGAIAFWPLDVPAGASAIFFGAVLLLWQPLGRTVFAGPAGARPVAKAE
ncbi:acyltransferase [Tsukamurella paurometabola]|nr:acyltransferase [Tsukamurella paurometabola]